MDNEERGRVLLALAQWMSDAVYQLDDVRSGCDDGGIILALQRDVIDLENRIRSCARMLYMSVCPSPWDIAAVAAAPREVVMDEGERDDAAS